jgi:hypothetical protein
MPYEVSDWKTHDHRAFAIRLNSQYADQLISLAEKNGTKISVEIRRAVREYCERMRQEEEAQAGTKAVA